MTTAYFDCFRGAGGDMIVAALVDAGADVDSLRRGLDSLGLRGYDLSIGPVTKQGFAATRFVVTSEKDRPQPHRHLSDIAGIIGAADLPDPVKTRSMRVFERLAEAEAAVHGTDVARIHFHEVGAVDSILDVVGAVLAMHLLAVDRVICSPLPVGSGTVVCEHGTLPVPAPATANLLKGVPLAACDETGELVTPTAAAVLTTMAEAFTSLPAMVVAKIGYGAGSRDGLHRPNLLRVLIGDESPAGDVDEITILETNLDDVSPQVVGHCIEVLLAAGALDVYAVPIQMKKSRPG
ncbi:MAG: nickel pincer cofactor biosynthesis protein LarC, partial [Phycisphaerae bacterium]